MSEEPKKVSEEDLVALRNLQSTWEVLTKRFGELHYEKKMVEIEMTQIDNAFDELETQRSQIVGRLQDGLGKGTVNLQTGEFIEET